MFPIKLCIFYGPSQIPIRTMFLKLYTILGTPHRNKICFILYILLLSPESGTEMGNFVSSIFNRLHWNNGISYEHTKYPQTAYQYASFMNITIVKKFENVCSNISYHTQRSSNLLSLSNICNDTMRGPFKCKHFVLYKQTRHKIQQQSSKVLNLHTLCEESPVRATLSRGT